MMAMLGFLVFLFYLIYNYLNATGSATSGRHGDLKSIILFGNSAYSKYLISFIQETNFLTSSDGETFEGFKILCKVVQTVLHFLI